MPDFAIRVVGTDQPDTLALLTAASAALTRPPLLLSVEMRRSSAVLGIRMYQPSQVLDRFRPRLREMVTVRLDAYADRRDDLSVIDLVVSTTIYVNPLNSTRPQDWSLPDEVKERAYIEAIQRNLNEDIRKTCRTGQWRSPRLFSCGLAVDAKLPLWVWQ
jgi:hypothetical protein